MLEWLHRGSTRLTSQLTHLGLIDNFFYLVSIVIDLGFYLVDNLRFRDDVLDTYCETCVDEPVVDYELNVWDDVAARLGAKVLPDDVDKTTVDVTDNFLRDDSGQEFSLLDDDEFVLWVHYIVFFSLVFKIDALRDNKT